MQSLRLLLPILLLGASALLNAAVLVYFGLRILRTLRSRAKPPSLKPTSLMPPAAAAPLHH